MSQGVHSTTHPAATTLTWLSRKLLATDTLSDFHRSLTDMPASPNLALRFFFSSVDHHSQAETIVSTLLV